LFQQIEPLIYCHRLPNLTAPLTFEDRQGNNIFKAFVEKKKLIALYAPSVFHRECAASDTLSITLQYRLKRIERSCFYGSFKHFSLRLQFQVTS
jgi:hypothetical protein